MEWVSIEVHKAIYMRLQALAVPLVDDVNSVLERLIAPAEKAREVKASGGKMMTIALPPPSKIWRSSRGEELPIGLELMGRYRNQKLSATVKANGIEFEGKTYPNPSTAAFAAKKKAGASDAAAPGNGWTFWYSRSKDNDAKWLPIDVLRKS